MVTEVDDRKTPSKSGTWEVLTPGGRHGVGGEVISVTDTSVWIPTLTPCSHWEGSFWVGLPPTLFLCIQLSKSLFSKVPRDRGRQVELVPKENYSILFLVSFLKNSSWFFLFPSLSVWRSSCLEPGSVTFLLARLLWPYRRLLSQICLIQMSSLQTSTQYWKNENDLSIVY